MKRSCQTYDSSTNCIWNAALIIVCPTLWHKHVNEKGFGETNHWIKCVLFSARDGRFVRWRPLLCGLRCRSVSGKEAGGCIDSFKPVRAAGSKIKQQHQSFARIYFIWLGPNGSGAGCLMSDCRSCVGGSLQKKKKKIKASHTGLGTVYGAKRLGLVINYTFNDGSLSCQLVAHEIVKSAAIKFTLQMVGDNVFSVS